MGEERSSEMLISNMLWVGVGGAGHLQIPRSGPALPLASSAPAQSINTTFSIHVKSPRYNYIGLPKASTLMIFEL